MPMDAFGSTMLLLSSSRLSLDLSHIYLVSMNTTQSKSIDIIPGIYLILFNFAVMDPSINLTNTFEFIMPSSNSIIIYTAWATSFHFSSNTVFYVNINNTNINISISLIKLNT